MQKTTFPVEIIVRDDASADGTADIIRAYCAGLPLLFKPIFEAENKYATGIPPFSETIKHASGHYIALCEGDDFWTDAMKLESQVAHLRSHRNVSLVSTNRLSTGEKSANAHTKGIQIRTLKDVLRGYIPPTQTIVYRNTPVVTEIRNIHSDIPSGDRIIAFACALLGELHHLPQITACYRDNGKGVWSRYSAIEREILSCERLVAFHKKLGIAPNSMLDQTLVERSAKVLFAGGQPLAKRLKYARNCAQESVHGYFGYTYRLMRHVIVRALQKLTTALSDA